MSEEDQNFGEALEAFTNDNTEPEQPKFKTDFDELIELFSTFPTEKEAKDYFKKHTSKLDKRFYNPKNPNKAYSRPNCYAAIARCREKGIFQTTPQLKLKDLTYRVDVPPTPPQTQPLEDNYTDNQDFNQYQPEPPTTNPYSFNQPLTQQEPEYVFVEPSPNDVEAAKDIAQIIFKKVAALANDPTAEMDNDEGKKFGRAVCIIFGDGTGKFDPRKLAGLTFGTSLIVRSDALFKAGKKIMGTVSEKLSGEKPNV
jgi:hypothetical protein